MAMKKHKGSALETAPPTAPGQDGFNVPSHVTTYNDGDFNAQYNMVGNCADNEQDVDPRGRHGKGK